jgi:DNA repair protein RadA/Sms
MFLSRGEIDTPGSAVLVSQEGTRPLLVEVQALVDRSTLGNPRRLCVGFDSNRLGMLLAILHRHAGLSLFDKDIFVNVAGGVRIAETAADLAISAAVISSLKDKVLGRQTAFFGELGLSGEVRPVTRGEDRLREAAKLGFSRAFIPKGNRIKESPEGLNVIKINSAAELFEQLTES